MLYAITNRLLCGTNEASPRASLVELAGVWAANGVAFIQLREKDMSARDQVELARAMLRAIHMAGQFGGERDAGTAAHRLRTPRLLINGRGDVALAADADGVHLPAGPGALTPAEVRGIFTAAGHSQMPIISVACHTLGEVKTARQQSPDCILFAPVFEKAILGNKIPSGAKGGRDSPQNLPGTGLALLEEACRAAAPVPVFALGGVNAENAADCIRAGAAGVAAIRMMQEPALVWQHLA